MDIKDLDSLDYSKLIELYREKTNEINEIKNASIISGEPWDDFVKKTRELAKERVFIEKQIRIKQDPELTYGKKWKGRKYSMDKFIEICNSGIINDADGIGYYASETAKSDIQIYPSDIEFNMYRKDFPYVIWIENQM